MEKKILYKTNIKFNNKSNTFLDHKFSKNRFEVLNKKSNFIYTPKNLKLSHNDLKNQKFLINSIKEPQIKKEKKKFTHRSFKFVNVVFENLNSKKGKNHPNSINIKKNRNYSNLPKRINLIDDLTKNLKFFKNDEKKVNIHKSLHENNINKKNIKKYIKKNKEIINNHSIINSKKKKKNDFFYKNQVLNTRPFNSEKKEYLLLKNNLINNFSKNKQNNSFFENKKITNLKQYNSEKKEILPIRENLLKNPIKYNFFKRNPFNEQKKTDGKKNLKFSYPTDDLKKNFFSNPKNLNLNKKRNIKSTRPTFSLTLRSEIRKPINKIEIKFSIELVNSNKKVTLFKTERNNLNKYNYMEHIIDFGDDLRPSIYHNVSKNGKKKEKYKNLEKILVKKNKYRSVNERKSTPPLHRKNPLFMNFEDLIKKKKDTLLIKDKKYYTRMVTK